VGEADYYNVFTGPVIVVGMPLLTFWLGWEARKLFDGK
jgi:hypothetical protein